MKKYFVFSVGVLVVLGFSGCSLNNVSSGKLTGGIIRSIDSGTTWQVKNKIDEKKSISSIEIVSIAIDPINISKVYLGTKNSGLLLSEDNAESWKKLNFPANENVYGISLNYFDSNEIYASGSFKGRGKIFKTKDGGENWEEVYAEPSENTYVTAMAMNRNNPGNIYVGTSKGTILKTSNGGASWNNLYSAKGPIADIEFAEDSSGNIYFLVYGEEVLITSEGGSEVKSVGDEDKSLRFNKIFSLEVDPNIEGTIYVGTEKGLFVSNDYGSSFNEVNIIASSKNFPIRAIAVNPFNSEEIIYSAAQAMYKSSDGGNEWSTTQLENSSTISNIEFNKNNPSTIFAGFRSFK